MIDLWPEVALLVLAAVVATILVRSRRPAAHWAERVVLLFVPLLPLVTSLKYAGRSDEAEVTFGLAVLATALMVLVYGALVVRLLWRPKASPGLIGVRYLSVLYVLSIAFWFALVYWSGSAAQAHQLVFSVLDCSDVTGPMVCREGVRELIYPESLYIAFGSLVTVGHSGITAASYWTRTIVLAEILVLVPGAIVAIRGD